MVLVVEAEYDIKHKDANRLVVYGGSTKLTNRGGEQYMHTK